MPDLETVTDHYAASGLIDAIRAGLEKLGLSPETAGIDDLAPVDEFHIGGRAATEHFLDQLGLTPADRVLDVGCGLGGAGRFAAHRYGCRVTGIDLTPDYVAAGSVLCAWLGIEDRVTLEQGDATATPYSDNTFDAAYMLHVGMNIADKTALTEELFRVVKPGGRLGIYDVMRVGPGDLVFPVPWATDARGSAVGSPDDYQKALRDAGFSVLSENDRRAFALDFFARLQAAAAEAKSPPPLGLHLLMGNTAATKIRNLVANIAEGRLAPIELLAEKPVEV